MDGAHPERGGAAGTVGGAVRRRGDLTASIPLTQMSIAGTVLTSTAPHATAVRRNRPDVLRANRLGTDPPHRPGDPAWAPTRNRSEPRHERDERGSLLRIPILN